MSDIKLWILWFNLPNFFGDQPQQIIYSTIVFDRSVKESTREKNHLNKQPQKSESKLFYLQTT